MFVCNYEFMQYFKKVLNLLDWTSLPFWFCSGYGWFCYQAAVQTQSDRLLVVPVGPGKEPTGPALSPPSAASFPEERMEPEVGGSLDQCDESGWPFKALIHLFFLVPMGHLVPHSVVYRDQQISITFLLFLEERMDLTWNTHANVNMIG